MAQESLPGQEHPVLDAHAHALIPAIEAAVAGQPGAEEARALGLRRDGAPSAAVTRQMVADRIPALTDPATRLADMDAAGVDVQLVSPSPGHYHYWADPGLAREVTQAAGEGIAALVARHPDRLLGLGLVPLQHPADCQAALEHAVTGCGLAGVEISSHAGQPGATVELSDERLDPFWARAAELGAIVFLHPFGCSLAERLDRFYLSNTVGQPVEHAVALSHLIFGGVLDRHPGLRVLAAHGGGYLPGYLGRSDHAWQSERLSKAHEQTESTRITDPEGGGPDRGPGPAAGHGGGRGGPRPGGGGPGGRPGGPEQGQPAGLQRAQQRVPVAAAVGQARLRRPARADGDRQQREGGDRGRDGGGP